jgi:hypothetical protein
MIEQYFAAIRTTPAVEIAILTRLTAEPAPHNSKANAELSCELRPHRGVAKGVRGVQDVGATTETISIAFSSEEISDQRFARRDQLVGQHIPGTDLKPSSPHQLGYFCDALGSDLEIVLQQDSLTVQEKGRARFGG